MWTTFFLVLALSTLVLYVPGYLFFRGIRFARLASCAAAPIYTLLIFEILALVCSRLGIFCSGFLLLGISLVCSIAVFCLSRIFLGHHSDHPTLPLFFSGIDSRKNLALFAGYILFALVVAMFVYVKQLDGATAFAGEYDNYYHLGVIRSFLESGNYSLFDATLYPSAVDEADSPWGAISSGYYPALWHMLVASVVSLTSCPLTLGVNVINTLVSSILFPSGIFLLLRTIFAQNDRVVAAGAIVAVSFTAFPWGLIMYGPLFPNLLAFALVPLAMTFFIYSAENKSATVFAAFLAAGATVAMAHPNAVFTLGVLLLPFLAILSTRLPLPRQIKRTPKAAIAFKAASCICALIIAAVIWYFLYKAPFLQGVINFSWQPFASKTQAVINLALTQLTKQSAPQIIMSAFVLLGTIYALVHRERLWMVFSLFATGIIYLACASCSAEGFIRHFLSGFWYTDSYRIAAMYALAAIPIAAMGVAALWSFVTALIKNHYQSLRKASLACIGCTLAIALAFLNFCPSYNIYGQGTVSTSFGILEEKIFKENDYVYDTSEKAFISEVKSIVGSDLVLNDPYDGSAFLYGAEGLNVFYRQFHKYGKEAGAETPTSELFRQSLCDYADDSDVRSAVEATGAKYVLLLDIPNDEGIASRMSSWDLYGDYDDWSGYYGITDSTPGFEVVLAVDDMRLYRIK